MILEGAARIFGNNIDTDLIIAARYLTETNEVELGKNLFKDLRPNFVNEMNKGDIIVAGNNFGCGSSREHAPLAIKGAGISAVIANSFARIFFRNAINVGLPIFVTSENLNSIEEGDKLSINASEGILLNKTKNKTYKFDPYPEFLLNLVQIGGLFNFTKNRLKEVQKNV
ncbi:3-isopropylmalate dehydratase small subunit [Thermodesulfobium acidiphilum]|nr:MAG: 3-isopropylmalate dehydratase [Thermodesulfobium narugense]